MPSKRLNDWIAYFQYLSNFMTPPQGMKPAEPDSMLPFAMMALQGKKGFKRTSYLKRFKEQIEPSDKVRMVLEDAQICPFVERLVKDLMFGIRRGSKKSDKKTNQYLASGTAKFKDDKFEEALVHFSNAIITAPYPEKGTSSAVSSKLGQCFAHRSSVFYELARFPEALLDIEDGLEVGVSLDERLELIQRKVKCQKSLGKEKEADETIKEANNWITSQVADKQLQEKSLQALGSTLEENLNQIIAGLDIEELELEEKEVEEKEEKAVNLLLPSASTAIKVDMEEGKGRCLRTMRTIAAGETIVKEKPFTARLYMMRRETNCWHCFETLENRFVPCSNCSLVRFCSFQCQRTSWQETHEAECDYLEALQHLQGSHSSLRIIIREGIEEAIKISREEKASQVETWVNRVFKNDYRSFTSLYAHWEQMPPEAIYRHAFVGAITTLIAEKMTLVTRTSDIFYQLAGLVMEHNLRLSTNTWSIYSVKQFEANGQPQKLGFGVYYTLSLVNHSCDPNTIQRWDGTTMTAFTKSPISAGDEITMSYGPTIGNKPLPERKMYLQRGYNFDCYCNGCEREMEANAIHYLKPPKVPTEPEAQAGAKHPGQHPGQQGQYPPMNYGPPGPPMNYGPNGPQPQYYGPPLVGPNGPQAPQPQFSYGPPPNGPQPQYGYGAQPNGLHPQGYPAQVPQQQYGYGPPSCGPRFQGPPGSSPQFSGPYGAPYGSPYGAPSSVRGPAPPPY